MNAIERLIEIGIEIAEREGLFDEETAAPVAAAPQPVMTTARQSGGSHEE